MLTLRVAIENCTGKERFESLLALLKRDQTGINVLGTIGHHEEDLDNTLGDRYQGMVNIEGVDETIVSLGTVDFGGGTCQHFRIPRLGACEVALLKA